MYLEVVSFDNWRQFPSGLKLKSLNMERRTYYVFLYCIFIEAKEFVQQTQNFQTEFLFMCIGSRRFLFKICMKIIERLDQILFPYDFSKISGRGLHFTSHNYNTYTIIMTVIATLMQTFLMIYGPNIANYTYLTYWGFTATFFYFTIAGFQNLLRRAYGKQLQLKTWKTIHFLFPDIMCLELMINGVYWFVFFPFIVKNSAESLGWLDIVQAIGAHFFPLLLLLVELFNNLVCFWTYKRMVTVILIMALYLVVNVVYTLNVDIIYPVLTYDDWLTYVFLVGAVIGVVVCYVFLRLFSKHYKEPKILELLGEKRTSIKNSLETQNSTPAMNQTETPNPILTFKPKNQNQTNKNEMSFGIGMAPTTLTCENTPCMIIIPTENSKTQEEKVSINQ